MFAGKANQISNLLWDLYCSDPAILNEAMEHLIFDQSSSSILRQPHEGLEDLFLIRAFLDPKACNGTISEHFLHKVNRDRLQKLDDTSLRKLIDPVDDCSVPIPTTYQLRTLPPHLEDIKRNITACLMTAETDIERFINSEKNSNLSLDESAIELEEKFSDKSTTLLLIAVSGSGKTQSMMNLLSREYGLYLQGFNFNGELDGIHGPKKIRGPSDIARLHQLIELSADIFDATTNSSTEFTWVRDWIELLRQGRMVIFSIFREYCSRLKLDQQTTARLWLKLRTQDKVDPFGDLFRLSCNYSHLVPDQTRHAIWHTSYLSETLRSSIRSTDGGPLFYLCLDEIQCAMEVRLGVLEGVPASLFDIWNELLQHVFAWVCVPKIVYAGTSLNASEAYESLTRTEYPDAVHAICARILRDEDPVDRFSSFPMVSTSEDCERIFRAHLWAVPVSIGVNSADSVEIAVSEGTELRGRPLWSVLYIEAITQTIEQSNAVMTGDTWRSTIQKVAKDVGDSIKQDLVKKLQHLLNSKKAFEVLEELFSVVLRSYLFDRPTAFKDSTGATLISQAFAVMKKLGDRHEVY